MPKPSVPASPSRIELRSSPALRGAETQGRPSAAPARAAMIEKSPTSQAIALKQMALGATIDFDEALRMDYRIVSRICRGHDFYEGVRAVIVDKDNRPNWAPELPRTEVDAYFAPLGDGELKFPGRGRMKYIMRQSRDGAIELVDRSPVTTENNDLMSSISRVGWEHALIWYMRTLAWVWMAKGLFHWAIILGALPALGQFTTMALPLQATIVAFACLDLLAAIGLWLAAAWGGAIWLLCAVVEAASPILKSVAAAIGYGGALLNIALVTGYFLLSWRAARERA